MAKHNAYCHFPVMCRKLYTKCPEKYEGKNPEALRRKTLPKLFKINLAVLTKVVKASLTADKREYKKANNEDGDSNYLGYVEGQRDYGEWLLKVLNGKIKL